MPIFSKRTSIPQRNDFKIIAVDCDLTLTKTTGWDEESCLSCEPNNDMIEACNKLYEKWNCVIIYTARHHNLYEPTVKWLEKNGVKYSAIRMNKLAVDFVFDDKTYNPNCKMCAGNIENICQK